MISTIIHKFILHNFFIHTSQVNLMIKNSRNKLLPIKRKPIPLLLDQIMMKKLFKYFSNKAREKRRIIFLNSFKITSKMKFLDIGASDGVYTTSLLKNTKLRKKNIYIADIDKNSLTKAKKKYGFKTILLKENQKMNFKNKYFDIVFSNSVIEHATISKKKIWKMYSGKKFKNESLKRQAKFAKEIIRLGKFYYVQTPYKYFFLETHSWLPFIQFLPRRILIPTLRIINLFWIKKTQPDWYLLNKKEMKKLFPKANIIKEKFFIFTKSLIAIKN